MLPYKLSFEASNASQEPSFTPVHDNIINEDKDLMDQENNFVFKDQIPPPFNNK